jgi:hypothetical protein
MSRWRSGTRAGRHSPAGRDKYDGVVVEPLGEPGRIGVGVPGGCIEGEPLACRAVARVKRLRALRIQTTTSYGELPPGAVDDLVRRPSALDVAHHHAAWGPGTGVVRLVLLPGDGSLRASGQVEASIGDGDVVRHSLRIVVPVGESLSHRLQQSIGAWGDLEVVASRLFTGPRVIDDQLRLPGLWELQPGDA